MDSDSQPTTRYHTLDLPEMGEVLEGRYRLERVIGEGGMGLVVQAHHLRLERQVAIKLMHQRLTNNKEFVRRFRREVLIAKELEHRNTVRIYDFGQTNSGVMYLVMEYLNGVELKELIQQGPMSFADAYEIGAQILDGLAEAHVIDVVHRDLKPGNIHICQSRRGNRVAKILDFGIAKSLGAAQQRITATGNLVGTGPYLAPELFLEEGCTKEADVYACGLVLFEMLTGRKLIDASSMGKTMARHLHMPLILPESLVDHPLGEVIDRALSKSLAERYSDAEYMLAALREADDDCDDRRLDPTEIEAAFEKMDAAFRERAKHLLPGIDASEPTIDLDEGDVELLDSSSMSVPKTPTTPSAATIRREVAEKDLLPALEKADPETIRREVAEKDLLPALEKADAAPAEVEDETKQDLTPVPEAAPAEAEDETKQDLTPAVATTAPKRAVAPSAQQATTTTPITEVLDSKNRRLAIIGVAVVLACAVVLALGALIIAVSNGDESTDGEVIVTEGEPADPPDEDRGTIGASGEADVRELVVSEGDAGPAADEADTEGARRSSGQAESGGDDPKSGGTSQPPSDDDKSKTKPRVEQRPRLIKQPKKQPTRRTRPTRSAPEVEEDKDDTKTFEEILNKRLGE